MLAKSRPQFVAQFAPRTGMTRDFPPSFFGIEAAAERAFVGLLEFERQFLDDLRLARAGDSQWPEILAHVCLEVRHFRDLPRAAAQSRMRSSSGAVPTRWSGPRGSVCSTFSGAVRRLPPTDRR